MYQIRSRFLVAFFILQLPFFSVCLKAQTKFVKEFTSEVAYIGRIEAPQHFMVFFKNGTFGEADKNLNFLWTKQLDKSPVTCVRYVKGWGYYVMLSGSRMVFIDEINNNVQWSKQYYTSGKAFFGKFEITKDTTLVLVEGAITGASNPNKKIVILYANKNGVPVKYFSVKHSINLNSNISDLSDFGVFGDKSVILFIDEVGLNGGHYSTVRVRESGSVAWSSHGFNDPLNPYWYYHPSIVKSLNKSYVFSYGMKIDTNHFCIGGVYSTHLPAPTTLPLPDLNVYEIDSSKVLMTGYRYAGINGPPNKDVPFIFEADLKNYKINMFNSFSDGVNYWKDGELINDYDSGYISSLKSGLMLFKSDSTGDAGCFSTSINLYFNFVKNPYSKGIDQNTVEVSDTANVSYSNYNVAIQNVIVAGTLHCFVGNNELIKNSESLCDIFIAPQSNILEVANLISPSVISIFNMLGEKVWLSKIATGTNHLDVSFLNNGVYIVEVAGGGFSKVQKVMINK